MKKIVMTIFITALTANSVSYATDSQLTQAAQKLQCALEEAKKVGIPEKEALALMARALAVQANAEGTSLDFLESELFHDAPQNSNTMLHILIGAAIGAGAITLGYLMYKWCIESTESKVKSAVGTLADGITKDPKATVKGVIAGAVANRSALMKLAAQNPEERAHIVQEALTGMTDGIKENFDTIAPYVDRSWNGKSAAEKKALKDRFLANIDVANINGHVTHVLAQNYQTVQRIQGLVMPPGAHLTIPAGAPVMVPAATDGIDG